MICDFSISCFSDLRNRARLDTNKMNNFFSTRRKRQHANIACEELTLADLAEPTAKRFKSKTAKPHFTSSNSLEEEAQKESKFARFDTIEELVRNMAQEQKEEQANEQTNELNTNNMDIDAIGSPNRNRREDDALSGAKKRKAKTIMRLKARLDIPEDENVERQQMSVIIASRRDKEKELLASVPANKRERVLEAMKAEPGSIAQNCASSAEYTKGMLQYVTYREVTELAIESMEELDEQEANMRLLEEEGRRGKASEKAFEKERQDLKERLQNEQASAKNRSKVC